MGGGNLAFADELDYKHCGIAFPLETLEQKIFEEMEEELIDESELEVKDVVTTVDLGPDENTSDDDEIKVVIKLQARGKHDFELNFRFALRNTPPQEWYGKEVSYPRNYYCSSFLEEDFFVAETDEYEICPHGDCGGQFSCCAPMEGTDKELCQENLPYSEHYGGFVCRISIYELEEHVLVEDEFPGPLVLTKVWPSGDWQFDLYEGLTGKVVSILRQKRRSL